MGQRTDRIEADIAPQLEPDLVANAIQHRGLHASGGEQRRQPRDVGAGFAGGFADRKAIAIDMADHPGGFDLGGGIDDAADRAFGAEFVPLPPTGIDTLQDRAFVAAAVFVEIPVGNAVDRGDDAGVWSEQGTHRLDRTGDGMRFQADDDEILMAEFGWIIGAAWPHHMGLIADQEFEPVVAHRRQMRAARHQADIGARARKLHTDISADRAGAVDADFHGIFLTRVRMSVI